MPAPIMLSNNRLVKAIKSIFGGSTQLFGWLREPSSGAWQRGFEPQPIPNLAAFGAFYACVTRIANDVSKLGVNIVEQDQTTGIWSPLPTNNALWLPLRRPNQYQNRMQFICHWLTAKLLYGNAYVLLVRDGRGIVNAMHPLDPRRVTPMVTPMGDVYYSLGGSDLAKIQQGAVVPSRDMIHDRCPSMWHPLVGVSPVYACGLSATQGLKIQANSAKFFDNMSRPSGILTAPAQISDDTAARLKRDWQENFTDGNIGKLAVLGDGLDYKPMTIAANDAQLIEQLKWTVEDIARAFSLPLYKIGAGPMPTAGNVESLHQQYYADALQVHIEAIELCLTQAFGLVNNRAVEFDLDGLMRTDQLTQVQMLSQAVSGAIMMPNEARARRNLPPVDGGSEVYLQQQNYSLAALARRDAGPDPFSQSQSQSTPADMTADDKSVLAALSAFIEGTEVGQQ